MNKNKKWILAIVAILILPIMVYLSFHLIDESDFSFFKRNSSDPTVSQDIPSSNVASNNQEASQSDTQEKNQSVINVISETESVGTLTKNEIENIEEDPIAQKTIEEVSKELEESIKETEEIRKELEAMRLDKERAIRIQNKLELDKKDLLEQKKDIDQILKNEKYEEWTIYIISGLLSLALIISFILIRFLLVWRQKIGGKDNQISIVPHQLIQELSRQEKMLENFLNQTQDYQKYSESSDREIIEILSSFRTSIEEKEQELTRWKKGYDLEIYKKFLIRFIDANEALEDAMENLESSQNNELILELNEAKELLEYALKATGVETFSPRIGDDIRDAFGIDEQYRTIPTKDENLVMTIAEVRKCGYFVRTAESKVCIIPSKVTVYVFNEEKKNEE